MRKIAREDWDDRQTNILENLPAPEEEELIGPEDIFQEVFIDLLGNYSFDQKCLRQIRDFFIVDEVSIELQSDVEKFVERILAQLDWNDNVSFDEFLSVVQSVFSEYNISFNQKTIKRLERLYEQSRGIFSLPAFLPNLTKFIRLLRAEGGWNYNRFISVIQPTINVGGKVVGKGSLSFLSKVLNELRGLNRDMFKGYESDEVSNISRSALALEIISFLEKFFRFSKQEVEDIRSLEDIKQDIETGKEPQERTYEKFPELVDYQKMLRMINRLSDIRDSIVSDISYVEEVVAKIRSIKSEASLISYIKRIPKNLMNETISELLEIRDVLTPLVSNLNLKKPIVDGYASVKVSIGDYSTTLSGSVKFDGYSLVWDVESLKDKEEGIVLSLAPIPIVFPQREICCYVDVDLSEYFKDFDELRSKFDWIPDSVVEQISRAILRGLSLEEDASLKPFTFLQQKLSVDSLKTDTRLLYWIAEHIPLDSFMGRVFGQHIPEIEIERHSTTYIEKAVEYFRENLEDIAYYSVMVSFLSAISNIWIGKFFDRNSYTFHLPLFLNAMYVSFDDSERRIIVHGIDLGWAQNNDEQRIVLHYMRDKNNYQMEIVSFGDRRSIAWLVRFLEEAISELPKPHIEEELKLDFSSIDPDQKLALESDALMLEVNGENISLSLALTFVIFRLDSIVSSINEFSSVASDLCHELGNYSRCIDFVQKDLEEWTLIDLNSFVEVVRDEIGEHRGSLHIASEYINDSSEKVFRLIEDALRGNASALNKLKLYFGTVFSDYLLTLKNILDELEAKPGLLGILVRYRSSLAAAVRMFVLSSTQAVKAPKLSELARASIMYASCYMLNMLSRDPKHQLVQYQGACLRAVEGIFNRVRLNLDSTRLINFITYIQRCFDWPTYLAKLSEKLTEAFLTFK